MAYTLEDANRLRELMRAAPDKPPNQRQMDKQAIVREVMDDIAAIQKRGYTLEEVAEMWAKRGSFEVTLPTLKSYLQRAKKTGAKGAAKAPRRPSSPRASERPCAAQPTAPKSDPAPARGADSDERSSATKSTQSEFIATDRKRL
jgi:hypothetical protein